MARLALRALMIAAIFTLSACASMAPKLETPTVELMGVQVLRVKVQNPNDIEVPVESIEFTAFLMGDRFGEGASYNPFVLPAKGEAEFDMYITTNFVSGFGRLVSRMGGHKLENVEYEITGKLHLQKGLMRTIPFNHKGLVNFSKAQKALE
jgi:LEA14-like dessication related protein